MSLLAKSLRQAMLTSSDYNTQEKLAEAAGISQAAVQKMLNGKTKKTKYLVEIAKILNVNPECLMSGEDCPQIGTIKEQPKVYAATPQPGDISNLLSVATPRSSAILEKLAAKLNNHELSDADMEIIEAIADRFTK